MASTVLTLPFIPALGTNGTTQSGAKLYAYDAGTLTPRSVYTDSALTIPHANPVVADGAGRFATIYLDPSVAYRFILKDSAGVQIGDIDNYTLNAAITNLAESGGAALIGFTEAGTGAVARTVQARLRDVVSVKDFGAKGDSDTSAGGTDDTAAIQAAIDYIDSLGGGTLYFPAGYYLVSSYLTLCANLRILGAGSRATYLVTAQAGGGGANAGENVRNGSILYSNWPSNGSNPLHMSIEHIGFWCTNLTNQGAAFYDNCGKLISIRNCFTKNFKYGFIFDQTELTDVTECDINPAGNSGACVWMVNGATLTPGNSGGFTNRLSVCRCELNGDSTVNLIDDDGGYAHTYQDNNYNGGANALNLSGATGCLIIGGEFESQTGNIIELPASSASGISVNSGVYIATAGNSSIRCFSGAGSVEVGGGVYFSGGGGTNPIVGAGNCSTISKGWVRNATSVALMDNAPDIFKESIEHQSAVPTSGFYRKGQVVLNSNPSNGSVLGWRCTVTGSPGTFETIYAGPQVLGQSAVAQSHTGDTTETTLATITIPAAALGANGRIEIDAHFSASGAGGTKTSRIKLDGTGVDSVATSTYPQVFRANIANRNSSSSQSYNSLRMAATGTALATGTLSAATANAKDITLTGQLAVGTDTITLESYAVRAWPKA